MSGRAFIQPAVLFYLLEEGTATMSRLVKLIGCSSKGLDFAIDAMRKAGQVQTATEGCGVGLALTRAGTEAALRVKREDFELVGVAA